MAAEVRLNVVADFSQFKANMAKIPGVTEAEAKKASAAFFREWQAKLKAATASVEKGSAGLAGYGKGAAQAKEATEKLAAAMGLVSPEAANVLRQVGMLSGSLSVLGGPLAAVGLLLGAGFLAWKSYHEEEEIANRIAANSAAVRKAIAPILEDTQKKLVALAVATGDLTAAEGEHASTAIDTLAKWRTAMGETIAKQAELRKAQDSVTTSVIDWVENVSASGGLLSGIAFVGAAVDGLTTDSAEYGAELDDLTAKVTDAAGAFKANRIATDELSDATAKAAANKTALAAAAKDAKKAAQDEADYYRELLVETDKIDRDVRDEANARAVEAGEEDRRLWDESAQAAIKAEKKKQDAIIESAKVRIAKAKAEKAAVISSTEDILSSTSDLFASLAEAQGKGAKQQALALFGISKAAAAAELIVSEVTAVAKAYELGPIAGSVAAVAMGVKFAAFTAQLAAAEPPSFATGGIVAADHTTIAASPGEGVVNKRGMSSLGEDGLAALNRGAASQSITVAMQYKHRIFDRFIDDNLRRNGPLARFIRDSSRS